MWVGVARSEYGAPKDRRRSAQPPGSSYAPGLVGGPSSQLIGNVVFANVGVANNIPFAAAFATVPLAIMAVYVLIMRRLGAFENL